MKILFVHEVSWQKKVTYEIHDYPELLQLRGHEVTFVEYDEKSSNDLRKTKPFKKHFWGTESICTRAHLGSRVRIVTPWRLLPSMCGRLFAIFFHPLIILRELIINKPDVIVIYSIPTNGWQTVLLARFFDIPTVFRAIDIPNSIRKTMFKRFIRTAERFVYQHVDMISTHNHSMAQYLQINKASSTSISVALPGVDLVRFFPKKPSDLIQKKLGIDSSDQVILFMGTLFSFSGIIEFLTCIENRLRTSEVHKVLIIGSGEDWDRINQTIVNLNLKHKVIVTGRIEYEYLNEYLNLGTIAILPFKKNDVTNRALPWKIAQYMACGLPTVSIDLEGLVSVIEPNMGVSFAQSTEALVDDVYRLLKDKDLLDRLAIETRLAAEYLARWDDLIVEFDQFLTNIVNGKFTS